MSLSVLIRAAIVLYLYYMLYNKVFSMKNNIAVNIGMAMGGVVLFLFGIRPIYFVVSKPIFLIAKNINIPENTAAILSSALSYFLLGIVNCLYIVLFASVRRWKPFPRTLKNVIGGSHYQYILILLFAVLPTVVFLYIYFRPMADSVINGFSGGMRNIGAEFTYNFFSYLQDYELFAAMYFTIMDV